MPYAGLVALSASLLASSPPMKPAGSVDARIQSRTFPSVFQAWNPADNLRGENPDATVARHDLIFHSPDFFGLQWEGRYPGLATEFTPDSIAQARLRRASLLKRNPHLILLTEIRYRDAHVSYLSAESDWWKRNSQGKLEYGWEEGGYIKLDFSKPEFREQVAKQAAAAVKSGVVDGVMLDWWDDDKLRLDLIQRVRRAIGDQALIMVNANDRTTPRTAPYINGYFMEAYRSETPDDWSRLAHTLRWAENHLRPPRINCLETWFHHSRDDFSLMRATTTMALTQSNGYCLFSDPNTLHSLDHLHNWYPFWNKGLGRPLGPGCLKPNGSYQRAFTGGMAVYNPPGNSPVKVTFAQPFLSRATGLRLKVHMVPSWDGDVFLP